MRPGRRRALLIAVPAHPRLDQVPGLKDAFPDLTFTARDAARLRGDLLRSGFAREHMTVLDDEDLTTEANIREQLGSFLNSCEDGDVGLVYFSGHGVRFDQTDYLLPSDIRAGWRPGGGRALDHHGLIGVVADELLAPLTSTATVMFCFDACRSEGDDPPALFDGMRINAPRQNVVFVSACEPGEYALGHDRGGSVLAEALSEAVAPESKARTVGQVIKHVSDRAPEIGQAYTHLKPPTVSVRWLGNDQSGGAHAEVALCEAMTYAGTWTESVGGSALWGRTDGTPAQHRRAKEQLAGLVAKVLDIRKLRRSTTEPDPWDDDLFPERLIKRIDSLVIAGGARLGPVETVVLLGAPFLREAALACGLAALHGAYGNGPADTAARDLLDDSFEDHLDRDMGDVRRAYRQIESRRRTLLDRGRTTDARSAEHWLRHRFLADWDLLWESREDAALDSLRAAVTLLVEAAESAAGRVLADEERGVLRQAVVQVVSQLGTGTPTGPTAPDGTQWESELSEVLCGEERWTWRPYDLATLLHVAGLLAIDPRMLDGVLIDHLGPREPTQIRPQTIVAEIRANKGFELTPDAESAEAVASGDSPATRWLLLFQCGSAALYTALDRLAAQIASVSQAIRRGRRDLRSGDLLFGLPQVVKTDGLRPRNKAFDRPPPRFQLAEDEVKPLIMGTQLYGDRMLAVRELYQNALDACRVRQARRRYAGAGPQGGGDSEQEHLAGSRVVFTQRIDDATGRMYIQCEDNGVGMTGEELRDLFARAGRRSEQSSARMREMRRWRRRGITTELNSRFGIGVFSYFMLADEIEVITRPVGVRGNVTTGESYRARVTAGSGLMHLSQDHEELEGGGTIVRLYVHDEHDADHERRPSLVQTLREFLWYSPLEVSAQEFGAEPVCWLPGELYGDSSLPSQRIKGGDGVWWVQGEGMLLADGLLVSKTGRPHGYVVNLRGRHRPTLSVDRNRILEYQEDGVENDLKAAVPALVEAAWNPFPLDWLWGLAGDQPSLTHTILDRLLESDVAALHPGRSRKDQLTDKANPLVSDIGCLPVDRLLLGDPIRRPGDLDFFVKWRRSAWGVDGRQEPVHAHVGFPRPSPLDALLLRDLPDGSWYGPLRAAADLGRPLREVTRHLRRYAIAGAHVPETADIDVLADFVPSRLMAALYQECRKAAQRGPRDTAEDDQFPLRMALLRVSDTHKANLGTLAQLCEPLSRLDPSIPGPPDLQGLDSHVVDARERRVLLNDDEAQQYGLLRESEEYPYSDLVGPVDVAYRAKQTGIPVAEIESIVRRFAPLGCRLVGPGPAQPLDEMQLVSLSVLLNGRPPFLPPGKIGLPHLVRLAARRGGTVGDTADWLTGWAGQLGFEAPEPEALASLSPPAWCGDLPHETTDTDVDENGDATADGPYPLSVWAVLSALDEQDDHSSLQEHIVAVEALVTAGLADPRAVDAVRTWMSHPRPSRPWEISQGHWFISGGQGGGIAPFVAPRPGKRNHISLFHLVGLAAKASDDLAGTAKNLRRKLAEYGFEVAEVPESAAELRPDLAVCNALCDNSGEWRERISLDTLLTYAERTGVGLVTAAADLNDYRPLGAPTLPVPPGLVRPPQPERRDRAAEYALLQSGLQEAWTLTPLALVMAAGRLGCGLREAFARLRLFEEVGLDMPFPDPGSSRVPDWRDAVVLTSRLTGREPALSGEVSPDHLLLAAEETGLTVGQVRELLQEYAPLFGLRLPQHGDEANDEANDG